MHNQELISARAEIFKALGHPARLTMVEALGKRPHCVCELVEMVPGTQATTSRHLDVLLRAGVVKRRKEGARMIYELALPCLLKAMPCVTEALRRRITRQAALLKPGRTRRV
ncbi:MAG: metalloregulator ArsR/SmtB family transcription factor [Candidatus Eisenbacteria bacterium]|nr:metalloregulator ArsR/SmtB family transcription factor [Candidatus Eisenbacteria bacterium]